MKILLLILLFFLSWSCTTSKQETLHEQWFNRKNSTEHGTIKNLTILTEAETVEEIKSFFNRNYIQEVKSEDSEIIMIGWSTFSGRSGKHWYIYLKQSFETKYNLVVYRYYEGETKRTFLKIKDKDLHIYNRSGVSIMRIPLKTIIRTSK